MTEELELILREHTERYPKMKPTDAVKLIYQNEFGGGHLIRDGRACLNALLREYASVERNISVPLYENIGNGMVRVNLAAVEESALERLCTEFIRSAAAHRGDMCSFLSKLETLKALTAQGVFAFGSTELDLYLAEYERAGCPAVSHSAEYRQYYSPAYRVILSSDAAFPGTKKP